jgi:hypothetical protein
MHPTGPREEAPSFSRSGRNAGKNILHLDPLLIQLEHER